MTKVIKESDQGHMPLNGRWIWKDESNSLEYTSNTGGDKSDKKKKQKGLHFQDAIVKGNNRAPSSVGGRSYGKGRGQAQHIRGSRSPGQRQTIKQSEEHKHVTLDDVKSVALDMLCEIEEIPNVFKGMYSSEAFDDFLKHLLCYFKCFFEKKQLEEQPSGFILEKSQAEKQAIIDACETLEIGQKLLGQSYCVLILGLGLDQQHHMGCGQSRVSSTYKDRGMYETLYSYCTFVVWIGFKRKNFEDTKKELGRILRSDTFNPAIRVKNAPEEIEGVEKKEEVKLTPAEYRRLHPKRPAIKSIVNQRSPALVSILPSPKEEAHWLFRRKGALSPTSLATVAREDPEDESVNMKALPGFSRKNFRIGIIGEPLSQFNAVTLAPLGSENDEDQEEGEEGEKTADAENNTKAPPSRAEKLQSRQQTGVSTTTTEAFSDED
ncbi:unnamed protein product [Owenia fusiformis]|uniref:Uncharacterized protein n=1 Tax=Owenia fusiformis TaxID=6347 RepID=A0A8J1U0P8_OWEFU|nr:unnamed protein product [Owenia fusiformis]